MIQINLPDTPEVRAILLQLGGHLADDVVAHFEELAESGDADIQDGVPKGSTPEQMGTAAELINDTFLRAIGLADDDGDILDGIKLGGTK